MNFLRCILVATLIASVLGHGVMIKPVPFNTNPTTQAPCGVAKVPSPASSATWGVGTQVTVTWSLIAGDGGNSVEGKIDLSGKYFIYLFIVIFFHYLIIVSGQGTSAAAFTTSVWELSDFPIGPNLQQYSHTFTVPAISCASSPGGLCLLRVCL